MKAIKVLTMLLFATLAGSIFSFASGLSFAAVTTVLIVASCIIPGNLGLLDTATISIDQIISEFGTFLGSNVNQILRLLTQPTVSMNYMRTVATKEGSYKMGKAVIDDVVQGFQKKFTPKGTATITPRTILQRRHKIDLSFYPDEVVDTWLGFLSDETSDRRTWPITRYIIEQLLIPKIAENRELRLIGQGVYEEPVDGVAQAVGKSMDGFCTILKALFASGTSHVNFIDLPDGMTYGSSFDNIELFAKKLPALYKSITMPLFVSQGIYENYHQRRRDLHGIMPTYKPTDDIILGTNMTLTPLPSMAGTDIMFATPKDNFIRLLDRNEGASAITIDRIHREICVSADWHEAVGFGIDEAIIAYVPTDEEEDSSSI